MPTTKPVDYYVLRNQLVLDKRSVGNTIGAFVILNMIALCTGGAIHAQTYSTSIIEYWGDEQNNSNYEEYKSIREKNGKQTIYNFGKNSTINYLVDGSTPLNNPKDVAIYVMSHGNVNTPPPIENSLTINGNLNILITDNKNGSTENERASTVGIAFYAGKSSLTTNDLISIETSSKAIDGDAYSLGVTIQNLGSASSSSGSRPAIGENTVFFNNLNIDLSSTTEGGGLAEAYGVEMMGNSSVTINELKISARAEGADENYAQGIRATDQYGLSGGTISINQADITTAINGYGQAIGVVSFLDLENNGSTIHIENGSILAESFDEQGEAFGVLAKGQSCTVTLGSDTAKSISVRAQGGRVNHALYSFDGTVSAKANQINLQADNIIYADGGSISVTSLKTGTLNGDVVTAYENAIASLDLRGDTHWSGATSRAYSSDINLALKNAAKWSMTNDSTLSTLTMDGGIVELAHTSGTRASHRTLIADNLSGAGGIFKVNTDIKNDQTDQIIIGKGSGAHQILVIPTGTGANTEEMNSFIVQQRAGDASFSLANKDGKVEQGLYFYELAERMGSNGQEWYLKRASSNIAPETPTGETEAALSGLAGHYAMWYSQLTDLRKRLGEMHDGTQTGLWVRGFADKFRLKGLADSGFNQNLYGGSVGYDLLAAANEDYTWIVGAQFRSAHANQHTNGRWDGRGDVTSVGGGLYSTWVHSKGWYVDLVATMDWYDHTIQANMSDGTGVNDDRSSYGIGASLEAGRKVNFGFSNENRNYWFLEPQFEVSYFWLKGGNFTTSNGMKIDQEDMDSLTTRAGFVLGKKFTLNRNGVHFIQPYVKAGFNYEFMGEQEARLNDVRLSSDLKGARGYYGLGVDWQASDNLRLYMQAEREHGEDFTREYNISGGLKWKF